MLRRHWMTLLIALMTLGLTLGQGCPQPTDDGDAGGGAVDDGSSDDGSTDDGATDDGSSDDDSSDDGSSDDGSSDGDDGGTVDPAQNHHVLVFEDIIPEGYQDTESCLQCHADKGQELLNSGHYQWEGESVNIEGYEDGIHGKKDLLNNFCIAVPSNEGRCSQCHPSYGYDSTSFDFTDATQADCLVCHAQDGGYAKAPTTAGLPVDTADLNAAAKSVDAPTRANCGSCHFYAGGGDNVKHGDLSSDLVAPTREMDVHMAVDGVNFACQNCHFTDEHQISGMALHHVGSDLTDCTTCHESSGIHDRPEIELHLDTIACQTCHIPAFARSMPTKVEWYWDEAGQDIDPIPTDDFGKATYDKKKGSFVWDMNVRPTLKWHNGKWNRMIIGVNDTFDSTPVVMAEPVGAMDDGLSKIYPFKKMIGRQPADAINDRILVPHLFPGPAGENAFWKNFEWGPALTEGAAYAGQEYSGEYTFVDTVMYLAVNHEVAPKEMALDCGDCHAGGIDFTDLGYEGDPWDTD